MSYHLKFRIYFMEYDPSRHAQLYRWHWPIAMGSGEYDVPKCAPGTPVSQCVHEIRAEARLADLVSSDCNPRSGLNALSPACKKGSVGFKPTFLGGHCHAPTCLSMELWNKDTGELICRNVPTWGTRRANATGLHRFDEMGYLALPPCLWSDTHPGLPNPPLLKWDTVLYSVKRTNSTYGHTGEMSRWQGHGLLV